MRAADGAGEGGDKKDPWSRRKPTGPRFLALLGTPALGVASLQSSYPPVCMGNDGDEEGRGQARFSEDSSVDFGPPASSRLAFHTADGMHAESGAVIIKPLRVYQFRRKGESSRSCRTMEPQTSMIPRAAASAITCLSNHVPMPLFLQLTVSGRIPIQASRLRGKPSTFTQDSATFDRQSSDGWRV